MTYLLKLKVPAYLDLPERWLTVSLGRCPEWVKSGENTFPNILEVLLYESGKLIFEWRKP